MIRIRNLNKTYFGASPLHVLKGINLDVEKGEFMSIMGSSGSGKSTLLNILGILDTYDTGEYFLDDVLIKNLSETKAAQLRNKKIGFIFQSFNLIPFKNAMENVALPLYYQGVSRKKRNILALEYLDKMGLKSHADHLPNELSGGQKQRIAIARALIAEPQIILADEPTGALDSKTSKDVMRILRDLNTVDGITMIIVTHELAVAEATDRVIHIKDGLISRNEDRKLLHIQANKLNKDESMLEQTFENERGDRSGEEVVRIEETTPSSKPIVISLEKSDSKGIEGEGLVSERALSIDSHLKETDINILNNFNYIDKDSENNILPNLTSISLEKSEEGGNEQSVVEHTDNILSEIKEIEIIKSEDESIIENISSKSISINLDKEISLSDVSDDVNTEDLSDTFDLLNDEVNQTDFIKPQVQIIETSFNYDENSTDKGNLEESFSNEEQPIKKNKSKIFIERIEPIVRETKEDLDQKKEELPRPKRKWDYI